VRRRQYIQHVVSATPFPTRNAAQAVYVAGDEMSAQPAIGAQRALEIDQGAAPSELEVSASPGFFEQIELPKPAVPLRGDLDHRQTAAVDCEAVAYFQSSAAEVHANRELDCFSGRADAFDDACFFYDAGKHVISN